MPDIFNPAKRSQVMSNIRGSGNRNTELKLISIMKEHGIKGWRRQRPVFGKPDFVFSPAKVAVFVDGCFWHGCPEHYSVPQTNVEFWRNKLLRNKRRDEEVTNHLIARGWRVIRIWEHELKRSTRGQVVERLMAAVGLDTADSSCDYLLVAEQATKYEISS